MKSPSELKNLVGAKKPGDTIGVKYERDRKILTATLTLKSYPTSSLGGEFEATNLTNELRSKFRVPPNVMGVVVIKVSEKMQKNEYGLRVGDVIEQVENMPIENMVTFEKAFEKYSGVKKRVYVNRQGMTLMLAID